MAKDPAVSLNPPMDNSEPLPPIPAQPTDLRTFGRGRDNSDSMGLKGSLLSDDE